MPDLARGGLVSRSDASGNHLEFSFNANGSTSQLESFLPGESTPVEIQDYVYLPSGDPNAGKVERIDIRRGDGTVVRSVTMAYYDGTTSFGELGQLASITSRDADGVVLDAKAYRYADGPSGDSLLQYMFDSEGLRLPGYDSSCREYFCHAPYCTSANSDRRALSARYKNSVR